jgi:hypothetical protein
VPRVTWWGVVLWFLAMLVVNVGVQFLVRRVKRRRSLQAGRVVVSARSTNTAAGRSAPRWRICRVTQEGGRLFLRRATDHPSEPGVELHAAEGHGRPVRGREAFRMVMGADRAVFVRSSAGLIEVAGPDEVLDWITARLAPADPT